MVESRIVQRNRFSGREDQAYRQYLGDQHMKYRRYSTLNRKRQTTYWTWRHTQGSERWKKGGGVFALFTDTHTSP